MIETGSIDLLNLLKQMDEETDNMEVVTDKE